MTKKEIKRIIEKDMMTRLETLIYCTEQNLRYCYKQEVNALQALVWTAESLGVLSFNDWEVINAMLTDTEYRMDY